MARRFQGCQHWERLSLAREALILSHRTAASWASAGKPVRMPWGALLWAKDAPAALFEEEVPSPEPTTRRLTIPPLVATMLTAHLFRPLSQLPGKSLRFYDRGNGTRPEPLGRGAPLLPGSRRAFSNEVRPVGSKAVLVTGCDSGFGFSLAKHLHSKGFLVFAGCLMKDQGGDGVKELDGLKSDRLRTIQLNVCKGEEVERVVEVVRSSLEDPEKGMWGLVNNAGISTFGEVEFTSMETYKEVAEVNLWGTVQMTKAFLPLIRRARGRIVNISSMLGRMANPARSPYCITKFGVEAFSDCLRYEMYPLGVKVSVVEPGNFIAATSLYNPERIQAIADKMWDELPEVVRKDYGRKYFDEKIARMQAYCNSGSTDISPVVSAWVTALSSAGVWLATLKEYIRKRKRG
uniref:D-beta-hydroxybutyrate dehydrogenase, mitochondrial n=1 Tax=Canis lupus familiaris TaxID=9615 RepID=A0A8C0PEV6_CANLF